MSISITQLEKVARNTASCSAADALYKTIVDSHLENNNLDAALKTAAKISYCSNADNALLSIFRKTPQIAAKEAVAERMSYCSHQDNAYLEVFNAKLASNDDQGAYTTACKMNYASNKNAAMLSLIKKTSNLPLAEKALSEMGLSSRGDAAENLVDRLLEQKNFAKALSLLPSAGWLDRLEKLFDKIFGKMEKNGLKKADLDLLLDSSKNLSLGKQKEVLQKLADKYAALGEKEGADKAQNKLKKAEEKIKKNIDELLVQFESSLFNITATLLITSVALAVLSASTSIVRDLKPLTNGVAHIAGIAATAANGLLSASAGVRA